MTEEEGMDFVEAFRGKFAAPENVQARLKHERTAGLTPQQRSRKGPPKQQVNFRATIQTRALIDALSGKLEMSVTDVMALAVEMLARAKGVNAGGTQ